MTWTTRTTRWQIRERHDRPLLIAGAFFALVSASFLSVWYQYYAGGMLGQIPPIILGVAALLIPGVLTWYQAGQAGRRRNLWSLLVFGGSALALFLPTRYLILSKAVPTSSYQAIPGIYSQAFTITLVALIPLAMGAFPIVLYGLAIGQIRPLAGLPPRPAILGVWVTGTLICAACQFIALLNPDLPPLISVNRSREIQLRIDPPPTVESEVITATWSKLLWRFGDGLPTGAKVVSGDRYAVRLSVPAFPGWEERVARLAAPGIVEIVYTGDTVLTPETEVSTTLQPLADKSVTYETLFSSPGLQRVEHWSGMEFSEVTVETSGEGRAALRFQLAAPTAQELRRSIAARESQNLALVLDNVVVIATSMQGDPSDGSFHVRGLSVEDAQLVAAVARYGILPLVPSVDTGE